MLVTYRASVLTPAGWRPVEVTASVLPVTEKTAEVLQVFAIDGERPAKWMSRTGSKRQAFDGLFFAGREVGKRKRLSSCERA